MNMSDEEKKVLKLLSSFKNNADKIKFLDLVNSALEGTEDNEFE